ncbi:hypothetical protein HDV05_004284 [Chytridiales sp. JEL 0842]|nr:hypothetical protein HDV05_004284 [Chytridiales sp. JEL 0842]
MCRRILPPRTYFVHRPTNRVLLSLVSHISKDSDPAQCARLLSPCLQFRDNRMLVPIFVGALVLPGVPCFMHIFEPRYRAMLKKIVGQGRVNFGMCLPAPDRGGVGGEGKPGPQRIAGDPCPQNSDSTFGVCSGGSCQNYLEYGIMLRIRSCEPIDETDQHASTTAHPSYATPSTKALNSTQPTPCTLPRYFVDAVGEYRFRVIERWLSDSGFNVGLVERIDDLEPEDEDEYQNVAELKDEMSGNYSHGVFEQQQLIQAENKKRNFCKDDDDRSEVDAMMLDSPESKSSTATLVASSVESSPVSKTFKADADIAMQDCTGDSMDSTFECPLTAFFEKNFKSCKTKTTPLQSISSSKFRPRKTSSSHIGRPKPVEMSTPTYTTNSYASSIPSNTSSMSGLSINTALQQYHNSQIPPPSTAYSTSFARRFDKQLPLPSFPSFTQAPSHIYPTPTKCIYISLSKVRSLIMSKLSALPPKARLHFELLNGTPPEDAPALTFWIAHLLPVSEYKKYKLLEMNCVRKRIEAVLELVEEDGGLKVLESAMMSASSPSGIAVK